MYVGLTVGAAHNFFFFKKFIVETVAGGEGSDSSGDGDRRLPKDGEPGTFRVIGAGFGRTGTYSLTLALEELGIPTLHTQHLYENEEIFKMWTDEIFMPSLENKHAELGTPDFDVITRHGYQATTDLPMALYFEQIHEKYPDCKFILTKRETSEVWFKSWDTLTRSITGPTNFGGMFISGVRQYSIYLRWLFALVNNDDSFLTSRDPKMVQNKEAAIASYERHNARVREVIPSSQLLEYNVRQGWEPLCDFLEIAPNDCPLDRPFPKTNSARSVRYQAASAAGTPLLLTFVVLCYALTSIFRRVTGRCVTEWVRHQSQLQIPNFMRKVVMGNPNCKKTQPSGSLLPLLSSSSSISSTTSSLKEC